MNQIFIIFLFYVSLSGNLLFAGERTTINLNGSWQFNQTENAFPPNEFTRTIAVPGLIHLAEPKIDDYNKFFQRPADTEIKDQHNLYNLSYIPKYSWYRKTVFLPTDVQGKEATISTKKSQFVTQVYIKCGRKTLRAKHKSPDSNHYWCYTR